MINIDFTTARELDWTKISWMPVQHFPRQVVIMFWRQTYSMRQPLLTYLPTLDDASGRARANRYISTECSLEEKTT
jgi:hypothetical protein